MHAQRFLAAVLVGLVSVATSSGQEAKNSRPPTLAELAAQSNFWMPASERIEPTKGLWGDDEHCLRSRSWQEHCMDCRETLSWLFANPSSSNACRCETNTSWWSHWLPRWLGGGD